jgi:phosphodiesterase/alkaline phosphatase D-like protein
MAAARAYHEWLPTRPKKDLLDYYRSFQFGEHGSLLAAYPTD